MEFVHSFDVLMLLFPIRNQAVFYNILFYYSQ